MKSEIRNPKSEVQKAGGVGRPAGNGLYLSACRSARQRLGLRQPPDALASAATGEGVCASRVCGHGEESGGGPPHSKTLARHRMHPGEAMSQVELRGSMVRFSSFGFLSDFGLRISGFHAVLAALAVAFTLGAWPTNAADILFFSFFRDNGQDGLYLATSTNGLQWTELKPPGKSFLQPQVGGKLMRDPCLALGPDGVFHLTWTTGWGQPPVIGLAHSTNLLQWSEQQAIPVMQSEPTARNAWAPELFYDGAQQHWLIFWSTTIPGRYPDTDKTGDDGWNHRIYFTTTKDFATFAPTKLFYDGGFNVIDATMLKARGKFYLVVKDETKVPVKKNLRLAVSDRAAGPFGPAGPPITGDWVEGPSAIQIGSECYIYFDHYAKPQYYGAVKSRDLARWQDISDQLSFPQGARHGTVLRVAESVVQRIQSKTQQP